MLRPDDDAGADSDSHLAAFAFGLVSRTLSLTTETEKNISIAMFTSTMSWVHPNTSKAVFTWSSLLRVPSTQGDPWPLEYLWEHHLIARGPQGAGGHTRT